VGTAALGCSVELCSTILLHRGKSSASLNRTAEGGCPNIG
jgi:hypothetical protein